MPVVCFILAVLVLLLALRVYALERDLRCCTQQLRARIASSSGTRLGLVAPNAAAEELVAQVNDLLEQRELDAVAASQQQRDLRRQIANVSHDLRTPLTSILGYLQMLEGDTLSPEERREYCGIVHARAQNLQELISGFYDLSRLESGEMTLARVRVDIAALLSALLASFYAQCEAANFTVTAELGERVPPIWGDAAAVTRILENLLRNALEHGEGWLTVRLYEEGDEVVAAVSNGAGALTQEDVPHLFERGYTADAMRTRRGTGLGLAIVQALAGQMGSVVTLDLKDGAFTAQLRCKAAE